MFATRISTKKRRGGRRRRRRSRRRRSCSSMNQLDDDNGGCGRDDDDDDDGCTKLMDHPLLSHLISSSHLSLLIDTVGTLNWCMCVCVWRTDCISMAGYFPISIIYFVSSTILVIGFSHGTPVFFFFFSGFLFILCCNTEHNLQSDWSNNGIKKYIENEQPFIRMKCHQMKWVRLFHTLFSIRRFVFFYINACTHVFALQVFLR